MARLRLPAVPVPGIAGARGTRGSQRRTRRFLLAGSRLSAGAVLAALVLLGVSVPAGAQTLTWSVVPSPSLGSDSTLQGVSCVSATACTAVGDYITGQGGPEATLIESWDGTSWSVMPSPNPGGPSGDGLSGVSCISANACTAVGLYSSSGGQYATLIESRDGTSWSVVPSPNPGIDSTLQGVSCTSATACTAVGWYTISNSQQYPLIESWDGTSWSVVPSPNRGVDSYLLGVSCTSATACTAVGHYATSSSHIETLIESWDGTSWSVVPSPTGSGRDLEAVSCTSATACTATGSYDAYYYPHRTRTLVESWDGTSWSVVPSPNRVVLSVLASVSCTSASACTAAGNSQSGRINSPGRTLIESWDGTSWSLVPSQNRGADSYLDAVSCTSATACTAAGSYDLSNGHSRTLIESGTASG